MINKLIEIVGKSVTRLGLEFLLMNLVTESTTLKKSLSFKIVT